MALEMDVSSRGSSISPREIQILPDGVQYLIWKSYNSTFVMKELILSQKFIWENPSDNLIDLCMDVGTIQQGYHDLEDMIEDHNMWCFHDCVKSKCANCVCYGFPCSNLAIHGFHNMKIADLWKPNFEIGVA